MCLAADRHLGEMRVRVTFKDVTYESLTDLVLLDAARKLSSDLPQLHVE